MSGRIEQVYPAPATTRASIYFSARLLSARRIGDLRVAESDRMAIAEALEAASIIHAPAGAAAG